MDDWSETPEKDKRKLYPTTAPDQTSRFTQLRLASLTVGGLTALHTTNLDLKSIFLRSSTNTKEQLKPPGFRLCLICPPDSIYIEKFVNNHPEQLNADEIQETNEEKLENPTNQPGNSTNSDQDPNQPTETSEEKPYETVYQSPTLNILKSPTSKLSNIHKALVHSRSLVQNTPKANQALHTQATEMNTPIGKEQESSRGPSGFFYKLGYTVDVVVAILEHNKLTRTENSHKANIIWNPKMNSLEQFAKLLPHQKVNHFPNSAQLGRKDCLNKNLSRLEEKFPKEFSFIPRSYILPQEEPVLLDVSVE